MRARHLSAADQAFFLYDHLEGEAREEIKYRPSTERCDPAKVLAVLQELYGSTDSYVALQEAFFSRRQQEGETLHEFSLALMSLMASVKQRAPSEMPNAEALLRDQFVENVIEGSLRRELKQAVRRQPVVTLLEIRAVAIRWEREGLPGVVRGRSHSVPSVMGLQCGVQSVPPMASPSQAFELTEVTAMLKLQQEQLNRLTETLAQLHTSQACPRPPYRGQVICRRCEQPGHFARECEVSTVGICFSTAGLAARSRSASGKLAPAVLQSQSSEGAITGSPVIVRDERGAKLIATCPHLDIIIGEVVVPCLVDTGSMVSTVTESFFRQHFEIWDQEKLRSCHWLQLRAANGLPIPYLGYLELEVELCGKLLPSFIPRVTPIGSLAYPITGEEIRGRCVPPPILSHFLARGLPSCLAVLFRFRIPGRPVHAQCRRAPLTRTCTAVEMTHE
ncbi:hypothetical protein N1851_002277 [Merluccius polli]|uniref:CCHC-type domain-containing protein n=1 Tax=Merluccius polli TaxID=89951 RepID=A0AA47PCD6_MERPO|nr:hypothetical protein N1851_002277 [Merluccius polli]